VPEVDPYQLGEQYQEQLDSAERKAAGVHYTPKWLVDGVVQMAFDGFTDADLEGITVADLACGSGAFLLGVADYLVGRGLSPSRALTVLWGSDIDADALEVTHVALGAWAERHGKRDTDRGANLAVGDALVKLPWDNAPSQFSVVIGNPPFLGQMKSPTTRAKKYNAKLERATGFQPSAYTDTAALFLARGVSITSPGGRVSMILPQSVAATRDGESARSFVDERATMTAAWVDEGDAFEAAVATWAPVFRVRTEHRDDAQAITERSVIVRRGDFSQHQVRTAGRATSWAWVLSDSPEVSLTNPATLGSLVNATAGFRDEYYALASAVVDDRTPSGDVCRLVTSGLIDPLVLHWGNRTARIAKQTWQAPCVDLQVIAKDFPKIERWARHRLVPKVVLPAQTRIPEPAIDWDGTLVPLTPVVSVEPYDPVDLDRVAAVLLAPPVAAWAAQRRGGTGLSREALRLSATDVESIPLPTEPTAWSEAAKLILDGRGDTSDPTARVMCVAELMTAAYEADGAVLRWWRERFERLRR